jgi:hypothetical protein
MVNRTIGSAQRGHNKGYLTFYNNVKHLTDDVIEYIEENKDLENEDFIDACKVIGSYTDRHG